MSVKVTGNEQVGKSAAQQCVLDVDQEKKPASREELRGGGLPDKRKKEGRKCNRKSSALDQASGKRDKLRGSLVGVRLTTIRCAQCPGFQTPLWHLSENDHQLLVSNQNM